MRLLLLPPLLGLLLPACSSSPAVETLGADAALAVDAGTDAAVADAAEPLDARADLDAAPLDASAPMLDAMLADASGPMADASSSDAGCEPVPTFSRGIDWEVRAIPDDVPMPMGWAALATDITAEGDVVYAFIAGAAPGPTRLVVVDSRDWSFEDVPGGTGAYNYWVAVDDSHRVHVVFQVGSAGQILYARREADGWSTTTLSERGSTPSDHRIAAAGDVVDVVYSIDRTLYDARFEGGALTTSTIATTTAPGAYSVTHDAEGRAYVVYVQTSREVMLATRDAAGTWRSETIASTGGSWGTSIVVDAAGAVYVAYSIDSRGGIVLARRAGACGAAWVPRIVVPVSGERDMRSALVLDEDHVPHVFWVRRNLADTSEPADIMHATRREDIEVLELDAGAWAGLQGPSARIASDGTLRVAYGYTPRSPLGDLRYAVGTLR